MTETLAYKELRRSRSDRMLAGVCGGLGRYFDVNPLFYRVGFVILTLLGGAGLLVYGAALLVIPAEGEQDSLAAEVLRDHRRRPLPLAGLALVVVAGIALLSRISLRLPGTGFWVALLVGGAVILWWDRRSGHNAAPAAEAGAVPDAGPLPQAGASADPGTAPGAGAATAAWSVGAPRRRRRALRALSIALGTLVLVTLAGLVAAAVFASGYLHLGDGVGNRTYHPSGVTTAMTYRLGVGDMTVDLANLSPAASGTHIHARVGVGQLRVIVPAGVAVRVTGHASWGDVRLFGSDEGGHDVTSVAGSGSPRLVVDASVGIGELEVSRVLG
jgi:phage shock protein PspC (stress-responsive transcriptional regulator)